MTVDRRKFLITAGLAMAEGRTLRTFAGDSALGSEGLPSGTLDAALREALPGEIPLIKRTWRPPNFETPVAYFNDAFTPNDAPSFVTT